MGHTTLAAEDIQTLAPQAKLVKVFNMIFAQLLMPESRQGNTLQIFVAGDAGGLFNRRYLEPIGEMNMCTSGASSAEAWSWLRLGYK